MCYCNNVAVWSNKKLLFFNQQKNTKPSRHHWGCLYEKLNSARKRLRRIRQIDAKFYFSKRQKRPSLVEVVEKVEDVVDQTLSRTYKKVDSSSCHPL